MLVEEGVKHRKDQIVSFYAMTNALKHHLCVFDFQKDYKNKPPPSQVTLRAI